MATTPFVKKLVDIVQQQYSNYRNMDEADPKLCGNERDSIRVKEIRLDKNRDIPQRSINPFISIIENLK